MIYRRSKGGPLFVMVQPKVSTRRAKISSMKSPRNLQPKRPSRLAVRTSSWPRRKLNGLRPSRKPNRKSRRLSKNSSRIAHRTRTQKVAIQRIIQVIRRILLTRTRVAMARATKAARGLSEVFKGAVRVAVNTKDSRILLGTRILLDTR